MIWEDKYIVKNLNILICNIVLIYLGHSYQLTRAIANLGYTS